MKRSTLNWLRSAQHRLHLSGFKIGTSEMRTGLSPDLLSKLDGIPPDIITLGSTSVEEFLRSHKIPIQSDEVGVQCLESE